MKSTSIYNTERRSPWIPTLGIKSPWIPTLGMKSPWILLIGTLLLLATCGGVQGQSGSEDLPQNTPLSADDAEIPLQNNPVDSDKTPLPPEPQEPVPTPLVPPVSQPPGDDTKIAEKPETEVADNKQETELKTGSELPTEQLTGPESKAGLLPSGKNDKNDSKSTNKDAKPAPSESETVAMETADKLEAVDGQDTNGENTPAVAPKPDVVDLETKNKTNTSANDKNTTKPNTDTSGDLNPPQNKNNSTESTETVTEVPPEVPKEDKTEAPVVVPPKEAVSSPEPVIPPSPATVPPTVPPVKTTSVKVPPIPVTSPPIVSVIPTGAPKEETEPPYVHVTDAAPSASTPKNSSLIAGKPTPATKFSPKVIAIIVGAALGLIAVIIIITVVVIVIRKKKQRNLKDIPIVENPRYISASSQQGHNYRFSRDASLMIGGPHLANNNHNEKSDMNSLRKKRRAPPPPNPFTGEVEAFPLSHDGVEYYEKDTPHGSEVELTTFGVKPQSEAHTKPATTEAVPRSADAVNTTDEEFSETDDDDLNHSTEELEGQALLNDIEHEMGYRIGKPGSATNANRKSLADKYQFSDDEEARDARDYDRKRDLESLADSEDLDGQDTVKYDVSDIAEVTDDVPESTKLNTSTAPYDPKLNPFES